MDEIDLHTRIDGIPCLIKAQVYPGTPGNMWEPPESAYVEFDVCDRRGRKAAWLERKLDKPAILDIKRQVLDTWVDDTP